MSMKMVWRIPSPRFIAPFSVSLLKSLLLDSTSLVILKAVAGEGRKGSHCFEILLLLGNQGIDGHGKKPKSLSLPPTVISITRLDSKLPRKRKSLLHSVFFSLFQVRPNFFTKMRRRRRKKPSREMIHDEIRRDPEQKKSYSSFSES